MKMLQVCALLLVTCALVAAQETRERRVPLTETAVAFDAGGIAVLEATLRTTSLNGAVDSPVTNTRLVVKNSSSVPYEFVSGLVTFYDGAGVRCGEGIFKAGALAVGEGFESDTPGIRIRCSSSTWRIVASNLVPRLAPNVTTATALRSNSNLVISVDGEEHPIQLDKPMVLTVGNTQRTIRVREAP